MYIIYTYIYIKIHNKIGKIIVVIFFCSLLFVIFSIIIIYFPNPSLRFETVGDMPGVVCSSRPSKDRTGRRPLQPHGRTLQPARRGGRGPCRCRWRAEPRAGGRRGAAGGGAGAAGAGRLLPGSAGHRQPAAAQVDVVCFFGGGGGALRGFVRGVGPGLQRKVTRVAQSHRTVEPRVDHTAPTHPPPICFGICLLFITTVKSVAILSYQKTSLWCTAMWSPKMHRRQKYVNHTEDIPDS